MTVIGKPGAVAVSFAGVQDPFRIMATTMMMFDGLTGAIATEKDIINALKQWHLDPTPENIEKVKSFFPADKVWESTPTTPEHELAVAK